MPTPKCLPSLLLALLTLAAVPRFALAQNDASPDAGHRSATASPASNKTVEDLSFDAFPAAAAKRAINPRAVSENVAAQLAARMPQYTPPPEPQKPSSDAGSRSATASPAQNDQVEDLDLRDTDQPKNQILRLPDYIVREKRPPVFRERDIHSPRGLAALAASRYLSETGQALNRFRLPLIGGGAQAYALARYEEDERLRTIRDLNDTARDLGQLSEAAAETGSGGTGSTWGNASATSGNASRRSTDAEASLRRLIRDTTSRRATEPPTKLAQ